MLSDEELAELTRRAHNHRWDAELAKWTCEIDMRTLLAEIHRLKDQLSQARQNTLDARLRNRSRP